MGRQTERFDLRIEPELRADIEHIAETEDRSIAWVVRDALRLYVEQKKRPAQATRRPGQEQRDTPRRLGH